MDGLYYPYSKSKGADQLRSYWAADLRLFFAYAKSRFSHNKAHIVLLRAYSLNGMFRITFRNEPYHEKTRFLHMQKERGRSAAQ